MQSCLFPVLHSATTGNSRSYIFFPPLTLPKVQPRGQEWGRREIKKPLQPKSSLTLQFLSSGVVSSNSSPSLKLISVFLKVLWVLITTLSPSVLIITVGLVTFPTCRVANPTPKPSRDKKNLSDIRVLHLFCHTWRYRNLFPRSRALSYHSEMLLSALLVPLHLKHP